MKQRRFVIIIDFSYFCKKMKCLNRNSKVAVTIKTASTVHNSSRKKSKIAWNGKLPSYFLEEASKSIRVTNELNGIDIIIEEAGIIKKISKSKQPVRIDTIKRKKRVLNESSYSLL